MKSTVLYIDDEIRELTKYKRKFNEHGINIITLATSDYLNVNWGDIDKFDGILVDFDLHKPIDGDILNINGITLITELRQTNPHIPIVIFTKMDIFNISKDKNLTETYSSIDQIFHKLKLFKIEDNQFLNDLLDLIDGYKIINNIAKKNSLVEVFKILECPKEDEKIIEKIIPPEILSYNSNFFTHKLAKFLRSSFLNYPGILYDSIHLSSFLGINQNDFLTKELLSFFSPAEYTGAFSSKKKLWWKSKIESLIFKQMNNDEIKTPLYQTFQKFWKRFSGLELEHNRCNSSLQVTDDICIMSPVDKVCYLMQEPVARSHSIQYYPDSRSLFFESARVSFKAIRESDDVNINYLDDIGKKMYRELREYRE
ncbi:MAG: hypothetical protein HeimC2_34170 [Candidatus Heimdallarchaeota archaeon LC_2]|nr:MAG: hypothetical protein HeimC2_34170 [Candidatus Heimdallarchaeota archaeon LC_2]